MSRNESPFSPTSLDSALGRAIPLAIVLALITLPALAQETRQERQAAERAHKATSLVPYEPNQLERRIELVDSLISSQRPVYLAMGSSLDGAGVAFGPGYRRRYGDTGSLDVHATWSIRNYKSVDGRINLPTVADRLTVDVHGSWIDAPSVAFYGRGSGSVEDNRSDFQYRSATVGVGGTMKLTSRIAFGGSLDSVRPEAKAAPTAPTLEPDYLRAAVQVQFDSRTSPEYSRGGSLLQVQWSDYHQTNAGANSFRRLDAEVQQFVPLMRENWVLAFRALASMTEADAGEAVPYFLEPELGGNTMLRGFSPWRFRDQNRLLLTGEYRWTAGPLVDMAVFVDAGKVAARRTDLNLTNLEFSQGIGIRLHSPSATVARLELARSREGMRLLLAFSPSF